MARGGSHTRIRPAGSATAAPSPPVLSAGPPAARGGAARAVTGYAPVNGLALYYEIHGAARTGTTPLVLLHGGGSTIDTSFGKLLPPLVKTRRVIAFDQQGHGRTADVDRPFSFERSADDAAALLRYLGIERADFFGYSNGGSIALQVAIRHPGLVRKLVVASAMFKRDGLSPEFWESMNHASLETMPAELKDAYREVAPHPERLQSFHDKSVKRMLDFRDWPTGAIRSIEAPVLVVIGDADIVRPEHAMEMRRLLPHAQLAVFPGTDHMSLMTRADWLVPMIEAFLDASSPSERASAARPESVEPPPVAGDARPAGEPAGGSGVFRGRTTTKGGVTMRFMMIMIPRVYQPETPAAERAGEGFSPPADAIARMMKFNEEMAKAGALVALDGLHPGFKGARVSFAGGKATVIDGPSVNAKEVVGGYWIIDAKSKEEAIGWARRCPAADGDVIEVRQVFEVSEFPEDVRKLAGSPTVREKTGKRKIA